MTNVRTRAFSDAAQTLWNSLPVSIKSKRNIIVFHHKLKIHLFKLAYPPIPTRGTATLDKIYINLTDLYHCPVVIAPIGLSDHMVVVCTPPAATKYTEPVVSKTFLRSCRPDDRAHFVAALHLISWETLFHLPSYEQQLQFFNSTIRTLLDTHIPE